MAELRVRVYNVRFGDAILVSVPDRDPATGVTTRRSILIDVGNVLQGEGGADQVFGPVLADVLRQLRGRPLDLYVMTHEHLDHVQGLLYAATRLYAPGELERRLGVRYAWLTASAAEDYYDRHPEAARQRHLHDAMHERIRGFLAAGPPEQALAFEAYLANNDPSRTGECVAYLRRLAAETHYVHRGYDLSAAHPFREARLSVWAPEEDTSAYYGRLQPLALAPPTGGGAPARSGRPEPPPGVDTGAFYGLVEARANGIADNLLAIDRARNDTSVVFSLEWRGWRLLFSGDAELRSWRTMEREGVLEPVHFLKVSHHGSHNGTPEGALLARVLPERAVDRRTRRAVISTWPETYSGIPHEPTSERLRGRCRLVSTVDDPERPYLDVRFRG